MLYFFWRLLLAHLLADFTFQTDRIAKWKRESISGVYFHVLIFLFFAVAVNYQYIPRKDFAVALLILGLAHVLEDQWRVVSIQKYHSHDNIFLFLYDQFIHVLMIFVVFPKQPPFAETEKWVYLAIVIVLASHFTTIFIYFLKKLFYKNAAIVTREKYHGIMERLLVVACFLIPGRLFYAALAIAVALIAFERYSIRGAKDLDTSVFNVTASNVMAVMFSVIARGIWY